MCISVVRGLGNASDFGNEAALRCLEEKFGKCLKVKQKSKINKKMCINIFLFNTSFFVY